MPENIPVMYTLPDASSVMAKPTAIFPRPSGRVDSGHLIIVPVLDGNVSRLRCKPVYVCNRLNAFWAMTEYARLDPVHEIGVNDCV